MCSVYIKYLPEVVRMAFQAQASHQLHTAAAMLSIRQLERGWGPVTAVTPAAIACALC
jgi:hypothetical protein